MRTMRRGRAGPARAEVVCSMSPSSPLYTGFDQSEHEWSGVATGREGTDVLRTARQAAVHSHTGRS